MRFIRLLIVSILATTGLVAVGAATQTASAVGSKKLTTQYTKVVKGEQASVEGLVTTGDSRKVRLQYRTKSSGPWTTKTTTTSAPNGYFMLPISTSRTRYWRFYAPASGGHSRIYGDSLKISVVKQKVQLFVVSFESRCSGIPNDTTVLVDFYPARPVRDVGFATNVGLQSDEQDK